MQQTRQEQHAAFWHIQNGGVCDTHQAQNLYEVDLGRTTFIPGFCALLLYGNSFGVSSTVTDHRYPKSPTVTRKGSLSDRQLGLFLEKGAQAKGYNGIRLAKRLGWSPSRVSRLLSGKRGVRAAVDLAAFLAICDITGTKRNDALKIGEDVWEQIWWQQYGENLPVRLDTLKLLEDTTCAMTSFDFGFVPPLLQTESYMRAFLQSQPLFPGEEIDARVDEGLRRQHIFDQKHSVRFEFYIHEYALTRTGGGRRVMSDQPHHLLRMAVRPHVAIRIVPDMPEIIETQPFQILEFAEFNPVVYLEFLNSVAFLERHNTVETYRCMVATLDKVARDRHASRAWLTVAAEDIEAT